jgi:hypothetical protein
MSDQLRIEELLPGGPASGQLDLTTAEAAEYLGVDPATLRRYPIPFVQYARRSARHYRLEDLERFRAARFVEPGLGG